MFGGIFRKKREGEAVAPNPRLSTAIEQNILGVLGARAIPAMPGAAQRAFQLSTDPGADARDFIEVIESDEALSARVLKIANSVFFDRGSRSETIEQAVIVIGINELRSLLNATTLSEIFPSHHRARSQLWANDVATALIARDITRRLLPEKEDIAFLGGLMHDIGKLLLVQRAAEPFTKVLARVEAEGIDFIVAEGDVFPFDHTEVGQLIAERWNFTDELKEIIRDHHRPLSGGETLSLPAIVSAADRISHALGIGHPPGFTRFRNHAVERLHEVWEAIGVEQATEREELARLRALLESEFDLFAGGKLE